MKRTFHCVAVGEHDEGAALEKAQALASVSNPDFLELIRDVRVAMEHEGGSLYLSAHREKIDAEGNIIPGGPPRSEEGEARRLAPGEWQTVLLNLTFNGVKFEIPNDVGASGLAAPALAYACDADFLDAVLAMKTALNYFGGQVWIVAHREEDTTLGYLFSYEHRDEKLIALPEPEPWVDPVEDPPPPDKPRPDPPERGPAEITDLRDEIEAEVEELEAAEVG